MNDQGTSHRQQNEKQRSAEENWDLENPSLPADVENRALRSGGYPYDKRMKRERYEQNLRLLQIELLKLQNWARHNGERIVILFEGRDAAGKGSTIRRFLEHLNPRHTRDVALAKPTEAERGQWYFQRYIAHLPTAGDMVLFDRSWYNRAGVERVMGFCTDAQLRKFLTEVPHFEAGLVRDGIHLFKFWLTIGREMQFKRLHARRHDPLKTWKLSEIDLVAVRKWDEYTDAKEDMFHYTDNDVSPWTVVRANDKRRTRINVIRHVLSSIDYTGKDVSIARSPDPKLVGRGPDYFFNA